MIAPMAGRTKATGYYSPVISPTEREAMTRSGRLRLQDGSLEKVCPECGEWLPADTEFWDTQISTRDRLRSYCRACRVERKVAA
jgi:hypothetical protein